jgi:predicted GNAT family acetyltransferase
MTQLAATQQIDTVMQPVTYAVAEAVTVQALTDAHQSEVLDFLALRPLHTVAMVGFIRDNGLDNSLNRGRFYACRNAQGRIIGVALIGHATLIETQNEEAIAAFARLAQECPNTHMLMGESDRVELFWSYYSESGREPRMVCREMLYEQRWPVAVRETVKALRQATLSDLPLIMPVHAQMAYDESGVNPLEVDPVGFRLRCARRIEQGRVWVWIEDGKLIFKADVVADTSAGVYLEGIYVNQEERGKGYGLRSLSQLSRTLLARTKSICLLVNEKNWQAQAFYLSAGYKLRASYDTIFLQSQH